jgi:L-alanine-DL-glutamate epimerase-like enolase superfamily enzyme
MADRIAAIETLCLELPYKKPVHFHSVTEDAGKYVLLRIFTKDGAEGIAECISRMPQTGDTPATIIKAIETQLSPALLGGDPLGRAGLIQRCGGVLDAAHRAALGLVDVALLDLEGKLRGMPVWKVLGGTAVPPPVPVTWIVHGNTVAEQVAEAEKAIYETGFSALKLKTWKRSMEDVDMVRAVRAAVGDDCIIWVDANGSYLEDEARAILSQLEKYGVSFIEDPCVPSDLDSMAALARDLPIPVLGDEITGNFEDAEKLVRANGVGGVSVKLRRTGIMESLKIIAMAEKSGVPVTIGTDSESRIGALARIHLRAACSHLAPWPTETHFFYKLARDVFDGEFIFQNGAISVPDVPGIGAGIDLKKLEKFRI